MKINIDITSISIIFHKHKRYEMVNNLKYFWQLANPNALMLIFPNKLLGRFKDILCIVFA